MSRVIKQQQQQQQLNLLSFLFSDTNPPFPAKDFSKYWWYVKRVLEFVALYGYVPEQLPTLWLGDDFSIGHRMQMRRIMSLGPKSLKEFNDKISTSDGWLLSEGPSREWFFTSIGAIRAEKFHNSNVVYEQADRLADAIELVERNSSNLEIERRRLVMETEQLKRECERLRATLYLLDRLGDKARKLLWRSDDKKQNDKNDGVRF